MLNMKKIMFLGCLGTMSLLEAAQPFSDLSLSGGWRSDEIDSKVIASATLEEGAPFGPYFQDKTDVKDIDIAFIGLQGQLSLPSCYCDCDSWWWSQFYVKGYAYWGDVYSGRFAQRNTDIPIGVPNGGSLNTGDINSGHSRDYSIGAGFLYPFCNDWGIGVSGGWAYDKLDLTVKNVINVAGECDDENCTGLSATLQGLKFKHRWKGPWVGVNLAYQTCDWDFNLGYEYHWARWNADFTLAVPDAAGEGCVGFSDKRKGKNGHGNVVFANIGTTINDCWTVGLGAKWSAYRVSGSLVPANNTFGGLGCPADEVDRVKHNDWDSFQVTLDIGYRF